MALQAIVSLSVAVLEAGARPAMTAADSSYQVLSSRPVDSLSTSELAWLRVQRRRRAEQAHPPARLAGISQFEPAPPEQDRFAWLASRSYAALSDSERAWLVAASEERERRYPQLRRSHAGAYLLVGLVVGAAIAVWSFERATDDLLGLALGAALSK